MEKTKTVGIICIVGFVLVAGIVLFVNRDKLVKKADPAEQAAA